jgi:hypothetical protein
MVKKTKADIHWLEDSQYKKALYHFRSQTLVLLTDIMGNSCSQDTIIETAFKLTRGAEDFALVCRGLDKRIKVID